MSIRNRIFWRVQREGDPPRAYANFRDFADVGGTRKMALIPEGQSRATTDPDIAVQIMSGILADFEKKRRGRAMGVLDEQALDQYIVHHLETMARGRENSTEWISASEKMLLRAAKFFGGAKDINAIGPKDLTKYVDWLRTQKSRTGNPISEATIRHHLNVLSAMYARAISEEVSVKNPVALMYSKPVPDGGESPWLETVDAAIYLDAARRFEPNGHAYPHLYALIATFLLTGGRQAEVFGLERRDISFERNLIHIRQNDWRRLKTRGSERVVPLWPQLKEILQAHLEVLPESQLVFPTFRSRQEGMLTDIRTSLSDITSGIPNWQHKVTTRVFRHTYCATRLQTLDRGEPVTVFTVSRELGHRDTSMVERVYGHLGEIRNRAAVVEYRVAQAAPA